MATLTWTTEHGRRVAAADGHRYVVRGRSLVVIDGMNREIATATAGNALAAMALGEEIATVRAERRAKVTA